MRKNISHSILWGTSGLRSRVTSCAADKGGVIDLHPEECLICKAPLEYLVRDEDMECAICHKRTPARPGASTAIMFAMTAIPRAWTPSSACAWRRLPPTPPLSSAG